MRFVRVTMTKIIKTKGSGDSTRDRINKYFAYEQVICNSTN